MEKLLMPFIEKNDDPKFTRGFEAGQIWSKMELNKNFKDYLFHTENKEQVELMCKRFGYGFIITVIDETWSELNAWINN